VGDGHRGAGAIIGINSFDQPNVQESKDNTSTSGSLQEERLAARPGTRSEAVA